MTKHQPAINRKRFGTADITSGTPNIDHCRAKVTNQGYAVSVTLTLNYHALQPESIAQAEADILDAASHALAEAARMRDANRPLFELPAAASPPPTGPHR
ncbi:hypothetical protein [Mycolicibacterium mageritense]|uniref:hypothetical protein n=1 Tax=Mycolicibacterium mageritense TaxID=53462 RepID=UPI001E2C9DCA|nr:hypothetical protein [Mycolicibacterium mageritense]MCC9186953.1 hypothetical protein [Mycolicibacterium mageritense]